MHLRGPEIVELKSIFAQCWDFRSNLNYKFMENAAILLIYFKFEIVLSSCVIRL